MFYQNQPFSLLFKMQDNAGSPVTGLVSGDITVNIAKPGALGFTLSPNTNLAEIGLGYYRVDVAASFADTLGELVAVVEGTGAVNFEKVLEISPTPLFGANTEDLCEVIGNIMDIAGNPVSGNACVVIRGVDLPIPAPNGFLSINKVVTNTDANGNFSVRLLRGQKVSFQIDNVSLKVVVDIPDQASANLRDLIPS